MKLDCLGLYLSQTRFRSRMELDKIKTGEIFKVLAVELAAEDDIISYIQAAW